MPTASVEQHECTGGLTRVTDATANDLLSLLRVFAFSLGEPTDETEAWFKRWLLDPGGYCCVGEPSPTSFSALLQVGKHSAREVM